MTATMEPTGAERAKLAEIRDLGVMRRQYAVSGVEVRAKTDGSTVIELSGHASVYERGYDMYGGPDKGGWTEFVDAGAGKKTLSEKPDVAFLLNHVGMTLARTKSGTLRLAEDKVGLKVNAELDTRVSIVNDIRVQLERGDLDEMSFAFRVMKQKWLDVDGEEVPWWDLAGIERHITEYSLQKGDVSVVNYGANPYTDIGLRAAARSGMVDPAALRRVADELDPAPSGAAAERSDDAERRRIETHHELMAQLHDKRVSSL